MEALGEGAVGVDGRGRERGRGRAHGRDEAQVRMRGEGVRAFMVVLLSLFVGMWNAATRAGALDAEGREALLKYVLRPPIALERVTEGPDGLVRITLKKPFADGTVAVDMDPLSLLCRLAASVPAPRFHTVRYAGVLAANSKLRSRIRIDDESLARASMRPFSRARA